jgi:hypothetical protein
LSRDVVKVSPARIRFRISVDFGDRVNHKKWAEAPRGPVTETDKYRSIVMRFVDEQPWEATPLFTSIYPRRFAEGETEIRGCASLEDLLTDYYRRVDALFADMQVHGFRQEVAGQRVAPIRVYLAQDGELLLGNQGNHRLAMAQVLGLETIVVDIVARHPRAPKVTFDAAPALDPELPDCARDIPAMTTPEERRCYYRLARTAAREGVVVELGAWLGAATAYLAAAVRDAGAPSKLQVYDRFVWKPSSHDKKAGGPIQGTQLEAFTRNMGPLLAHMDVHADELAKLAWSGGPVSLLVCDAPKRIREIALVLTAFADAVRPGTLLAWQDFAYFPSYDIPAAMIRLGQKVEFVEAVSPGSTVVLRVVEPWTPAEVSDQALALKAWTPKEVEARWAEWEARLPEALRPRFACGAALFLCDIGAGDRGAAVLRSVLERKDAYVLPKWRYLLNERKALMLRYAPLVKVIEACG